MAARQGIPTATPAYEVEGDGLTMTVRLTADGRVQIKSGEDNFLALSPATTRLLAHHMNIVADSAPKPKRIRPSRAKPKEQAAEVPTPSTEEQL